MRRERVVVLGLDRSKVSDLISLLETGFSVSETDQYFLLYRGKQIAMIHSHSTDRCG